MDYSDSTKGKKKHKKSITPDFGSLFMIKTKKLPFKKKMEDSLFEHFSWYVHLEKFPTRRISAKDEVPGWLGCHLGGL